MMPFLMRGRNESAFAFEQTLQLEGTLRWLEGRPGVRFFTLYLAALARVLQERPQLNRFIAGRLTWQRRTIRVAFAVKRTLDEAGGLTDVVMDLDPAWSVEELGAHVDAEISRLRSGALHSSELESQRFLRLPRVLLDLAVGLLGWLDHHGLAPRALTEGNPLHASVFVANLGSVGLDAGFHHLFEAGTCSVFAVLGRVQPLPVVDEASGAVVARPCVRVCYTFDERVADGLSCARALERLRALIEDPAAWVAPPPAPGEPARPPPGAGTPPPPPA